MTAPTKWYWHQFGTEDDGMTTVATFKTDKPDPPRTEIVRGALIDAFGDEMGELLPDESFRFLTTTDYDPKADEEEDA